MPVKTQQRCEIFARMGRWFGVEARIPERQAKIDACLKAGKNADTFGMISGIAIDGSGSSNEKVFSNVEPARYVPFE